MAISTQSFSTFISNAVAAVQSAASALIDITVGSILLAAMEAAAGMTLWLQGIALQIAALTRFASSVGADADSWGADFGFARLPAANADGQVTFARFTATNQASIQAAIQIGTNPDGSPIWSGGALVQTADGTQEFQVIPDTTQGAYNAGLNVYIIAAGASTAVASVESVNAEAAANVTAGSVSILSQSIPFVDTVSNAAPMTGGADPETDTAFKARFPQYLASLSRATKAAISYAIEQIGTEVDFTLTENLSYAGASQPGYFFVVVDNGTGSPPGGFLSVVSSAIDAIRGFTINFGVFAPVLVTANVSLTITTAAGVSHSAAVAAAIAAIQGGVNVLPIGGDLPYTLLSSLAWSVPGVTNVTGITLNGGTADLVASPLQIIKTGTVAVS